MESEKKIEKDSKKNDEKSFNSISFTNYRKIVTAE